MNWWSNTKITILLKHASSNSSNHHLLVLVGITVYFHTQVISLFLPVDLTVSDIEECLGPELLARRNLHEGDPRWGLADLRHPVGKAVVSRRPAKVPTIGIIQETDVKGRRVQNYWIHHSFHEVTNPYKWQISQHPACTVLLLCIH